MVVADGAYAGEVSWGRTALMVMAALGLWYLPFGTLFNTVVLLMLSLGLVKDPA